MSSAVPTPDPHRKPVKLVDEHDQGPEDRDLELALVALREMFEDELARNERLKSQARQAFAVALAFFALAQTVAFGSFQVASLESETERRIVLILAAISALGVVATGLLAMRIDRGMDVAHLSTDSVLAAARDATAVRPAAMDLAESYATAVDVIRAGVRRQTARVYDVQVTAGATLVAVLIELFCALYLRLR